MSSIDLLIRGGIIVSPTGLGMADIAVLQGRIVGIGEGSFGEASQVIDATGLHVFPGIIDSHVHFNEPGRTEWEGIATGSQALAAGGGTLFFDMPLNAHPPTLDAESFRLKCEAAERSSVTDFALWGGLVPENLDSLEELADQGVMGFKAFMSNSGIDDFNHVDPTTLREGMKRAAKLKLPVAVHAESDAMTRKLMQEKIASGRTDVRAYLDSRPIAAELEAITRAIDLAGEIGCSLHIVHVSSAAGVALVGEAKRNGIDVTCETCPHYLVLTDEDMVRLGAVAKCAPPLRSSAEQESLWRRVLAGDVDTIGSDHSPSPPGMKKDPDFFKVWGGISGVQHTLPMLLNRCRKELRISDGIDEEVRDFEIIPSNDQLSKLTSLLSQNVARRFRLPISKGRLEVGCDADLALVQLGHQTEIMPGDLFYRHKQTPYRGYLNDAVRRTLVRGKTVVFPSGNIVAKPAGRLVKPLR